MKMVMAVVSKGEAEDVVDALVEAGYTATSMESRGGVLRQAYETLVIAVPAENLDAVLTIICCSSHSCVSVERVDASDETVVPSLHDVPQVGGAVVFVWDLERMKRC